MSKHTETTSPSQPHGDPDSDHQIGLVAEVGSAPRVSPTAALSFSEPEEQITIEHLLAICPPDSRELISEAYRFAERMHSGQKRRSGQPYILHPLTVAYYLANLNLDPPSIAAGLLHDVLEDTAITAEELEELFPDPIPSIVKGVTKISRMNFHTNREAQVENLRIMILAMARDIRVVIVKLCDRLHNMKTLKYLDEDKRLEIAGETIEIYAPLANRLGMASIKSDMEDLAMRWLYPESYHKISRHIAKKRAERERLVEEAIEYLRDYLMPSHPNLVITGRPKHFFSIHRKMKQQGLTIDQIYDLNALRILVDEESQCYEILGLIHAIWPPMPGRFKDYIGMPKRNMYQSIHTTVLGLGGTITEIQIRTHNMHRVAEHGIAAHWAYKEVGPEIQDDERLTWLRQLTEWITDANEPEGLLEALKKDVFADRVLCFTPRGDVIELPAHATPIDFAYAIHSKVGERCVGAKINGRMVNLRTELQNSDVVEIVTAANGHPSRDWLDYTVTGRARQKIKHWLKARNIDEWVDLGRRALNRLFQERGLRVVPSELDAELQKLCESYKLQTVNDLLVEIGFGSISSHAALARMKPEWARPPERKSTRKAAPGRDKSKKGGGALIIDGMENTLTRLANCCQPIPGDEVIAYITRGRGVTVHHVDCPNIQRARRDPEEGDRLLRAAWNPDVGGTYNATLHVEAVDRNGLLNSITGTITSTGLFIKGSYTKSDMTRGTAVLQFELSVHNAQEIDDVLKKIMLERGVVRAFRRRRGLD